MSNFMQTNKKFFRIVSVEQISNLWVLWHPFRHDERPVFANVLLLISQSALSLIDKFFFAGVGGGGGGGGGKFLVPIEK